ncbi:hypothetical protein HP398_29805 [Brevibacillus sp. HB1.4B]|uniref:hypothetical protein n=1 Tax=Brevibacillus sp. HB1.4B TaxID=2738845 RepID=UPI00156AF71C|nr:hypothetical protein [Brevibacillus sp. HB1.4B]NRS20618.1 hypothetical protein [Brevibacillus sp. HB1.4B]
MGQLKLLLCHTDGETTWGKTFCRKGIYYPIVSENENYYSVTTELAEMHPITKERYRKWFQLVEVERAYYELMT